MPRRVRGVRRTPTQAAWDRSTDALALTLGRALRGARIGAGLTQSQVGQLAGVTQGTISALERGVTTTISLVVISRVARACGTSLHAYVEQSSGAELPRDIAHLRAQNLVVEMTSPGGWRPWPEHAIDDAAVGSRSVDVLLERRRPDGSVEIAVIEVIDWFADVGASMRDWDRRLARVERRGVALRTVETPSGIVLPRVSGCWVIRATHRNRQLIAELRGLFAARFPGSGRAWLRAWATNADMPDTSVLLWVSVKGDRIWPARW